MAEPGPTLRALTEYRDQAQYIEGKLRSLVVSARYEGASWEQIGQALGITRQAAYQRFDKDT